MSIKTRALTMLSALTDRYSLARRAGAQFQGERDLNIVLGYPVRLEYIDYWTKYERQDIAGRIVDMPAQECWRGEIVVTDNDAGNDTPFVRDWVALNKRLRAIHMLTRVDKVSGIGRYGVLLVGLKDGLDLHHPAAKVRGPDDVLYLSPFSEKHAEITRWDTDPQSPRFGKPMEYRITLSAGVETFAPTLAGHTMQQAIVHHSRIIHIAEGLLEDEVFGRPRLQRVFNRLEDMQKLAGGSAEIFWQTAAHLLHVDIDKDAEVDPGDLELLDDQLQEVMHNIRRTIQTQGAKVQAIGGDDVDPTGVFDVLQTLIASAAEIPMRILFGSERGELASSQDQEEWHGRIQQRRETFAEATILRPLVDMLVALGAMAAPAGGEFDVNWPVLGEPSDLERADVALKVAQAAQALTAAKSEAWRVVGLHELREMVRLPGEMSPIPAGMDMNLMQDGSERVVPAPLVDEDEEDFEDDDAAEDEEV